jgi:Flp pilus assembly protein TadD
LALAAGRAALAAGNFAEALQQADLALTAKPEDTEARKLKTEAGDALQAATEREQEYRLAMAAGRAALAAGNFAEALRQADLALATKPDDLEAWRLEADAKRKMMVENQLGLRHKHQQAMAAGRAALTAGNFAVAIEQADVALAAKPNDPEARELREEAEGGRKKLQEESSARDQQYQAAVAAARAALTAGNFAGAIEQADLALAARPEDPEARKLKAEAEGALEEAAAREQQYRLALAAGRTALTAGNFAGAIGQADLALAANPNDPAARQLRQEAEAGRKQLQEASVRDQQFQAALAAGRAALSAGRFAVAVQQADLALAAKPGFPEAQTLKEAAGREQRFKTAMEAGRVALVTSHFVEAIEQADLALTAKPDASEARYLKQEAEDKYRSLQEEAEREQKFQLLLEAGRTALAAGRFVGAVRQADQALAARPNDPEARNLKQAAEAGQKYQLAMEAGRAALTAGHFAGGIEQADLALAAKPDDPEARELKQAAAAGQMYELAMAAGRTALAAGHFAGGIGQADLALAARPDDPEARELKQAAETGQKYEMALAAGRAALAAGHFAEAVQQADLALATKPGDSAARELKQEAETGQKYEQAMEEGRAALSAERFGEAIQRFDEALAVRPGAPELLPELRLALQNQIKRLAPGARKRSDLIELESVLKKHDDLFSQGAGRDPRGQTTVLETDLTGLVTHARSRVETQRKKLGRLVMVAGVVIGVAIGVTAWAVWPVSVSTVMANAHSLALNGNIPGIEQLETKYPHLKARLDAELVQARSVVGDVLAKAQNEAANLAVEDIDKLIIDHPGLKPQLDPLRAEAASKLKEIEDEAKAAFLAADVGAIKEIQDKYPNIKELGIFLTRAESQRTNVLTQANNFAELFDLDSIRSLETKYSKLKAELETILAGAKAKMDNIVAMAKTMAERGDVPGIEQLERQYPQLKPLLDLELNRARGVVRDVRVKGQNDVTNFALEDIDKLITNYPVLKPQLDPLRAEVVSKLKELEGEVENQRTNVLNQAENFAELLDLDAIRSLETTYPKWKPELETILAGAKAKVDNVEASATTMAKKGDVQGIERLEEQYPKLMSQLAPLHAAAVTEARRIIELQYQTAMTAGHKALEDGNNAEAGKQADLALKLKPGDTDALNLKDAAKKSAIDPDVDKFLTINNLYPNRKSLPMSFVYVAANGSWPGGLIGASPVTLNQFYGSGGDAPVTKRNPLQAEDFCTSLTQKELNAGHILSGWKYRLPKSEEWQSLSNLKPNPLSAPGGKLVIGKLLVPIMNKPYGFFHNSSSDPTGNPTPSFADASDVSTNVVIKVVLVNK